MLLFWFFVYWAVGVTIFMTRSFGDSTTAELTAEYNRRVIAESGWGWFLMTWIIGTMIWPVTLVLAHIFKDHIERDVRRKLFDGERWHRVWNGGSAHRRSRGWECPHCHRYSFMVAGRGDELECGWCKGRWNATDTEVTFESGNMRCHKCGRQQNENELYALEPCTPDRGARATCPACYQR